MTEQIKVTNNMLYAASQLFARNSKATPADYYRAMHAVAPQPEAREPIKQPATEEAREPIKQPPTEEDRLHDEDHWAGDDMMGASS